MNCPHCGYAYHEGECKKQPVKIFKAHLLYNEKLGKSGEITLSIKRTSAPPREISTHRATSLLPPTGNIKTNARQQRTVDIDPLTTYSFLSKPPANTKNTQPGFLQISKVSLFPQQKPVKTIHPPVFQRGKTPSPNPRGIPSQQADTLTSARSSLLSGRQARTGSLPPVISQRPLPAKTNANNIDKAKSIKKVSFSAFSNYAELPQRANELQSPLEMGFHDNLLVGIENEFWGSRVVWVNYADPVEKTISSNLEDRARPKYDEVFAKSQGFSPYIHQLRRLALVADNISIENNNSGLEIVSGPMRNSNELETLLNHCSRLINTVADMVTTKKYRKSIGSTCVIKMTDIVDVFNAKLEPNDPHRLVAAETRKTGDNPERAGCYCVIANKTASERLGARPVANVSQVNIEIPLRNIGNEKDTGILEFFGKNRESFEESRRQANVIIDSCFREEAAKFANSSTGKSAATKCDKPQTTFLTQYFEEEKEDSVGISLRHGLVDKQVKPETIKLAKLRSIFTLAIYNMAAVARGCHNQWIGSQKNVFRLLFKTPAGVLLFGKDGLKAIKGETGRDHAVVQAVMARLGSDVAFRERFEKQLLDCVVLATRIQGITGRKEPSSMVSTFVKKFAEGSPDTGLFLKGELDLKDDLLDKPLPPRLVEVGGQKEIVVVAETRMGKNRLADATRIGAYSAKSMETFATLKQDLQTPIRSEEKKTYS
ncbi:MULTISPECIES: hypothetical protein [unclassified Corallococcus]|uniref:hypothetical protein n=1 Tax=unclassified Corallococcus TaxID=2685029 RepID=UPI001A8FC5AE|nr:MULTISPECIES: hypothetical protein [unclassified Corallococcus]MBN9684335.1 hypothetical protein [Corallococcus sp. NCSPR001]WAS84186.1 hypothetical protein O0N60_33460 [Corallococcus sp. NCRR]